MNARNSSRCFLGCAAALAWCIVGSVALAEEIGWLESFSLATDRAVPLAQLIPGTEDYYYYHALHYQNTEQWAKAADTLKAWVDRYSWTPRATEIQNRQALLTYNQNPQQTLELLRQRLNLRFDHQREQLNQKPNLPTKLDPALIGRDRLMQRALSDYPNSLQGFQDAALDWLAQAKLAPELRRQLLARLQRPDHANLPQLVVADLNHQFSGGFGQWPIHGRLLLAQLDECLKLKPELRSQPSFIHTYLVRLQPSADVNWRQDRAALAAYLDRLWDFVRTLAPAQNSLKAHVLYHRLVADRAQGKYDADLFLEYLKLPKHVVYVQPKLIQNLENQRFAANLGEDFSPGTLLPPVGDDEPLVRSYLLHFFVTAEDYRAYVPYISEQYLKEVFAEAKITSGLGDGERWYSLLPPATYRQLKDRIDLDFAYTNKTEFAPAEPVALDVYVKNVETLIVKVFEVNTQNYYRQNQREIGTDINLDGLVAGEEQTVAYHEPALRRVRRHFEFPKLNRRGVYVIDFIGNGRASRALVHKGRLRYLVRTSVAGQVFTVLDEENARVPEATLWLAGTLYHADNSGTIAVPFTGQPGRQPIVLSQGDFSSLEFFQQEAENYQLSAGFYVDREELIARRQAELIVRPQLSMNGTPVSGKVLEDVRLSITSVDLDGLVTTKDVPNFRLFEDRESTYDFRVPQRTASVRFELKARVHSQSQNRKLDLAAGETFALNEIDKTDNTEDLHLLHIAGNYAIDLLGKTGEARPDRPLRIELKMRDFTQPVHIDLQTDDHGRTLLGPLPGVLAITAGGPQASSHTWPIRDDEHTYAQVIHGTTGQPIEIPYMGHAAEPDRAELSLLELRGGQFTADRFGNLKLDGGLLSLGKLQPGDYSLLLKRSGTHIHLRVTEGVRREGYAMGGYRKLQLENQQPLQLAPVEVKAEGLRVRVQNATPLARVHVFATRFEPAYQAYDELAHVVIPEPYAITTPRPESLYMAGRDIGDEYRYIIQRHFASKFPGNMLDRPSLLLNPWAVRTTQTGEQEAQAGSDFGRAADKAGQSAGRKQAGEAAVQTPQDFADLDFLAASSLVLSNLQPNKDGFIELKREDLGPHQQLVIVAVDPWNVASRIVSLPETKTEYLDLRLAKGLDPAQHYLLRRQISFVPAGGTLTLADVGSSRFEAYDTLARCFALYAALNNDARLVEFGFLRDWPSLKPEEKRDEYQKHASHELHVFLYKKDPEFFRTAIRPFLANKKEKQFVDHWLLDDDLGPYLKPWNFAQLNTFERALLGVRMAGQHASVARLVTDAVDLQPPDAERFERLFNTALLGSALNQENLVWQTVEAAAIPFDQPYNRIAGPGVTAGQGSGGGPNAPAPPAAPAAAAMAAEKPQNAARALKRDGTEFAKKAAKGALRERGARSKNGEADAKAEREEMDELLVDETRAANDRRVRQQMQQYFRPLDKTMEWAESNYYHLPLEEQSPELIAPNPFWKEFANHDPAKPFLPTNLAEATHSAPEMLMALALMDLPFKAAEHTTKFTGARMTLTAAGPLVAYYEEIQPAAKVAENSPILVSQNFFRQGERYRQVGGEQVDNFVSDEFLVNVVYGCHIVVTNPGSSRKKVEVLLQVPTGALPVAGGKYTRSAHLDLQPYHTQTLEYFFYFAAPGKFPHYPVQIGTGDEVLAFAAAQTLNVVDKPTRVDEHSWEYISQFGSEDGVLRFLERENLLQVNLERIAWRMQDKNFFQRTLKLLDQRHVYNQVLWSYGVRHNDVAAIRQFLQFANEFVAQCGEWLDSPLLSIDPITRHWYQQLDYRPLVNARSSQLGRQRQILNDRFFQQYERLLKVLSYRRQPSDMELMSLTYYLLLQDRVQEGIDFFSRVDASQLPTRVQYDYFTAYLNFYKSQPQLARQIAARYQDYPVKQWQQAFANIVNQANEIDHSDVLVADSEDRTQRQTSQAAATPSFDFAVEGTAVKLNYQNLAQIQVQYYLMDVELLFSRNPFVQGESRQFANVRPNLTQQLKLPAQSGAFEFHLPETLVHGNVLVEIVAAGQTRSQPYYSHALDTQVIENYGQVRVTQGGKPLPKVYVKAYARLRDGRVKFYKDGYTDLRGRFDYASLSTNELEFVDKFALLILSEEQGAMVREALPPKQ